MVVVVFGFILTFILGLDDGKKKDGVNTCLFACKCLIVAQVNTYERRGNVKICFKLHTFTLMSI